MKIDGCSEILQRITPQDPTIVENVVTWFDLCECGFGHFNTFLWLFTLTKVFTPQFIDYRDWYVIHPSFYSRSPFVVDIFHGINQIVLFIEDATRAPALQIADLYTHPIYTQIDEIYRNESFDLYGRVLCEDVS
jgi:hypothetical protein